MCSSCARSDKFFADVYAVLKKWEFIILRIEKLLLWEKLLPSLIFSACVHLIFWFVLLSNHSTLFIICCFLFAALCCKASEKWLQRWFNDPNSCSESVSTSEDSSHALSIEELSHLISEVLLFVMALLNKLSPCRRNRPHLFFLISSSSSILCIILSRYVSGITIAYTVLNLTLIFPTLVHHNVLARFGNFISPILLRLEEEFDKNLETKEEREAGERELYEPIVTAVNKAFPNLSTKDDAFFLSDDFLFGKHAVMRSDSDDLDTSEAVFIKQFVPSFSSEDVDRLFSQALGESEHTASHLRELDRGTLKTNVQQTSTPSSIRVAFTTPSKGSGSPLPWTMADEYATDDDESSEIADEITSYSETIHYLNKPSKDGDVADLEDFVVIPNTD